VSVAGKGLGGGGGLPWVPVRYLIIFRQQHNNFNAFIVNLKPVDVVKSERSKTSRNHCHCLLCRVEDGDRHCHGPDKVIEDSTCSTDETNSCIYLELYKYILF
jgi:hypothetical protein